MPLYFRLSTIFICSLLSSCSLLKPTVHTELTQLRTGQYQLDPSHMSLQFKVSHLGLSTYVGRFNRVEASLDFTPENMSHSQLQARVYIDSIDTNNSSLDSTLCSNWFDCERYPHAFFESTQVSAEGRGFRFEGNLTLKGVTQPIQLYGEFLGGAVNRLNGRYTLGFKAEGVMKRSDFGIDNYLAIVGDEVTLEIHAEFLRQ